MALITILDLVLAKSAEKLLVDRSKAGSTKDEGMTEAFGGVAGPDPSPSARRSEAVPECTGATLLPRRSVRLEIAGIQYLRGFCAAGVVIDHASGMVALPKYFGQTILSGSLSAGATGVDLFFLISGFIIAVVSLQRVNLAPRISKTLFYWKRAIRILPLMWLAVLSYAVLRSVFRSTDVDVEAYLRAFFLYPGGGVEPNVIWTLRHEAMFYIIFALTFLGRSWLRPILLLWFVSPLIYTTLTGAALIGPGMTWADVLFSSANLQFGAGFLIGLFWLRRAERPLLVHRHAALALLVLTIALMAGSRLSPYPWRSIPTTLWITALSLPLVWYATRIGHADHVLLRGAMLLGNASYSIYLFHLHILSAILGISARLAPTCPAEIAIATSFMIAIGGGVVVHLYVERPLLRRTDEWAAHLSRFTRGAKPAAVPRPDRSASDPV